jgi:hypothetical protein
MTVQSKAAPKTKAAQANAERDITDAELAEYLLAIAHRTAGSESARQGRRVAPKKPK